MTITLLGIPILAPPFGGEFESTAFAIFYVEAEDLITSTVNRDTEVQNLYDIVLANITASSLSDSKSLKSLGFRNLKMEEVSWNVAPSVSHIPLVVIKFLINEFRNKNKLGLHRRNNVLAPLLGLLLGLNRDFFGYYIISGCK